MENSELKRLVETMEEIIHQLKDKNEWNKLINVYFEAVNNWESNVTKS